MSNTKENIISVEMLTKVAVITSDFLKYQTNFLNVIGVCNAAIITNHCFFGKGLVKQLKSYKNSYLHLKKMILQINEISIMEETEDFCFFVEKTYTLFYLLKHIELEFVINGYSETLMAQQNYMLPDLSEKANAA